MTLEITNSIEDNDLKNLSFKYRRICTIQIETSDDTKNSEFILGSFFTYSWGKKCYFIERDETVFFDKIFKYAKEIGKPIVCLFKSESFNTKFLMRYCSKKLNISPEIEQYNFRTYAIRLLEDTKEYKDNLHYGDKITYSKAYNRLSFKDIDICLEKFPYTIDIYKKEFPYNIVEHAVSEFRTKIKKIDIKVVRNMISSNDKKLIKRGYKLLKEKINLDTLELYKAMTSYYKNYYMFC